MRLLFRKTLRDLRATWAQSLSLVAIVAIGVAAFVALTGAYRNLSSSYDRTYRQFRFEDADFSVRSASETAARVAARVRGVAAVTARLVIDAGLRLPGGEEVRARLIGLPAGRRPAVNDLLVQRGRFLSPSDPSGAVVESNFANARGLSPGDAIAPVVAGRAHPLRVAGLAVSPEYLLVAPSRQDPEASARSFAVVFVPLTTLQRLAGAHGEVNDLAVRLAPAANRAAVGRAIAADLAAYGVQAVTWRRDQPSNARLRSTLDSARSMATLAPLLILIAGAVSLYLMLGRTVRAQRPLIGLVKALGYRNRTIRGHYLACALMVGAAGAATGVAGGLLLARLVTTAYAGRLGIPLVESRWHPGTLLLAAAASVILAVLAGLGPARAATRLAPAQAMRVDPAASGPGGRRLLHVRLVHLPLWLRLPLRNVFRARRRSASTAVGVLSAFVLLLMVLGLISSVNDLFNRTYNRVERWDAVASFPQPISARTLSEIGHWRGIRQIEPAMRLPASVNAGGRSQDVLLTGFAPSQTMHVFQIPPGSQPAQALAPGRIVIPRGLADQLRLAGGDTVTVDTSLGSTRLRVGAISQESQTANAYISLAQARTLTRARAAPVNSLYLRIDPRLTPAINARLRTDVRPDRIFCTGRTISGADVAGSPGAEHLLELMEQVSAYMRSPSVEAWADLEITKPQLRALLLLRRAPLRMSELAAGLGTSMPAATSLVDRLVAKGLVSRVPDPQDRRVVLSQLTPFGQEQFDRMWRAGRQQLQALAGCLTADELATVTRGLEVLASAVRRQAEGQSVARDAQARGDPE